MTFWDSIKPSKRSAVPRAVSLVEDGKVLSVEWDDGLRTELTARTLRQGCPCAECVEEWTGKRTLDIDRVPANLSILGVAPIGNYALSFTFSDAHRLGIYNWETLRALCERSARPD